MRRNEAPTPSSERAQRTEAGEQTRRELGCRAVAICCPECGHELSPILPGVGVEMPSSKSNDRKSIGGRAAIVHDRKAKLQQKNRRNRRGAAIVVDGGEAVIRVAHDMSLATQ